MNIDILALLLTFLIVSLFGFSILGALILFVSRDTTKVPEILTRLQIVESMLMRLVADVDAEIGTDDKTPEIWKTADGKYTATSFEDLIGMMASDPSGPLSPDEVNAIRSIFEKILGEKDEDDDQDKDNWKKK